MKYCPFCRSSLKKNKNHQSACPNCAFVDYNNPRPTASAIIEKDNKILLVKRSWHPFKGYWDLVGGFVDYYETPEEALKREIREEIGVKVLESKLFRIAKGIYTDYHTKSRLSVIDHQYIVKKYQGTLKASSDVEQIKWFAKNNLPPFEKIAFENIRQGIRLYLSKVKPNKKRGRSKAH